VVYAIGVLEYIISCRTHPLGDGGGGRRRRRAIRRLIGLLPRPTLQQKHTSIAPAMDCRWACLSCAMPPKTMKLRHPASLGPAK